MFNTDPVAKARKRAEREAAAARSSAEKAERSSQKEQEAYLKTPVGQAETALQNGQTFFQFTAPVSKVSGKATDAGLALLALGAPSFPSASTTTRRFDSTDVLGQIEELGWRLEHVGYVFVETGEISRGKVLSSGDVSRTDGYVEGIYLFRRTEPAADSGTQSDAL